MNWIHAGLFFFGPGAKLIIKASLRKGLTMASQASVDSNSNSYQFKNTNKWDTRQLVTMALMCAISVLLSFIEFPLIPGVAFLKFDASNMPAMVSGFAWGPLAGISVGVVSAIIHGIMLADFSGAIMNILIIICYVFPASFIYKKMHNWKGAIIGLVVAIITSTIAAIFANLAITSFYMTTPELPFEEAYQIVLSMIVPVILPFNLAKAAINSVLTLIVYKSISNLITPKKKQVKGK